MLRFEQVSVGDDLPALVKPAISRLQLALYASAGADHNPIHVDEAAARFGGLPGVIAHGMLTMGFLGQLLTQWVPRRQVSSFSARFVGMAFPDDVITCTGKIVGKRVEGGRNLVDLAIAATNQKGETLQSGTATVTLP